MQSPCTREFIRILRLLEEHSLSALKHSVQYALEIGASSADALRLIIEQQQERPIDLFCLDGRPHLKLVRVEQTRRGRLIRQCRSCRGRRMNRLIRVTTKRPWRSRSTSLC